MKIIKINKDKAEIRLSENEIFAIRQVFSEVCHGIKIDNFEQTIGVGKDEAKQFMSYFQKLRESINPNNSVAPSIIMRKNCNIRTEKYDLCFYIRKTDSTGENLKFLIALQERYTGKPIIKTAPDIIATKRLREQIYSLSSQIDTQTSVSFLNEAVVVNISNAQSNQSDSVDEPALNIEFNFQRGIPISNQTDSSNIPIIFTSTANSDSIAKFINKVEDFLNNRVNQ